jgi:hypothetical protein
MLERTNHQIHLTQLLERLGSQDFCVKNIVETLITRSFDAHSGFINCFESASPQDFEVFSDSNSRSVNKAESLSWPLFEGHLSASSYLPIRAFRGAPSRLWGPVDKLRIFRSSGTNSGPEGRSWSCFSQDGLRFYKASSITSFLGVLESRVLPFSGDFLNMEFLSLIPPVENWPDSSLAQMIEWFSEIWPTTYAVEPDPKSFQKLMHQFSGLGKPLCIFGTAFHFVNLLDACRAAGTKPVSLPAGSIIIETGGTKGKSRKIERQDLYGLLSDSFKVSQAAIISEYGMCELASQAWDYVDARTPEPATLESRRFKFPWWVKLAVMTHPSQYSSSGSGTLTIQDFARTDLMSPQQVFPIQTEDLAEVSTLGSFRLRGRIPNAPLKGCSMLAEDALVKTTPSLTETTHASEKGPILDPKNEDLMDHARKSYALFDTLHGDEELKKRLTLELSSDWLAKQALDNLIASRPANIEGMINAARHASGHQKIPKRWLIVAPASHSIAAIHPILIGLTLGLDLRVRVPTIANIPSNQTCLHRLLELASDAGFDLVTLDSSWRLGANDLLDGEHILMFGDDDTCAWMQSFAPNRVRSFSNATSVTVTHSSTLDRKTACQRIIKDQLALRQRGCLSSRMIFVVGGDETTINNNLMHALPEEFTKSPTTPGELAARSAECVRLAQLGFQVNTQSHAMTQEAVPSTLIASKKTRLKDLEKEARAALSRLDLVIPVLILPESISEFDIISNLPKSLAIKAVSISDNTYAAFEDSQKSHFLPKDLQPTRHGNLDVPMFDGSHLGAPFFAELM